MQAVNVHALITGYDTVGDHTEFIVQISCNGGLWRISRRFSDFDQLHSRLLRRFGDLIEAQLPEKQWFGRFDPNFLVKRQASLQEYLASLLQVPGILEDPALLHFLELEKHLELHGDLSMTGAGSNGRSSGMWGTKSAVLTENDRLSAIVENAAQAFIDISEVPEPLEAEQAAQRKNEILSAAQGLLSEQKIAELFDSTVTTLWLPKAPASSSTETVITRLEHKSEDDPRSYEETRDFVWSVLENVESALHLDVAALSSVELVSVMSSSALPASLSASTPALAPALSSSLDASPEEYGSSSNSYNGASPSF